MKTTTTSFRVYAKSEMKAPQIPNTANVAAVPEKERGELRGEFVGNPFYCSGERRLLLLLPYQLDEGVVGQSRYGIVSQVPWTTVA